MKNLLNLLFVSIFMININAAESESISNSARINTHTISLSGSISDKLTGENLAGVEVQLIGTEEKTYTDFDGRFEFKNIVPGAQALRVQLISYHDIVKNVFVSNDNEPLNIKLESKTK